MYPSHTFKGRQRDQAMYEWIKALHVIAVITWMTGMPYLPRLFVYPCEAEPGTQQAGALQVRGPAHS